MDPRQSQHDGETYSENVQADDPLTHPAAQSCPKVGLLDGLVDTAGGRTGLPIASRALREVLHRPGARTLGTSWTVLVARSITDTPENIRHVAVVPPTGRQGGGGDTGCSHIQSERTKVYTAT